MVFTSFIQQYITCKYLAGLFHTSALLVAPTRLGLVGGVGTEFTAVVGRRVGTVSAARLQAACRCTLTPGSPLRQTPVHWKGEVSYITRNMTTIMPW